VEVILCSENVENSRARMERRRASARDIRRCLAPVVRRPHQRPGSLGWITTRLPSREMSPPDFRSLKIRLGQGNSGLSLGHPKYCA
jgi:hypothetical protein